MLETVIVGGGLCGLALANGLLLQGREFVLYEARPRLGGRILTERLARSGLPVDLGPAWYWPDLHPRLAGMVATLGLAAFPQWDSGVALRQRNPDAAPEEMPAGAVHGGAMRLAGGMGALVAALVDRLPPDSLRTAHELTRIIDADDHVLLYFRGAEGALRVRARHVVLAIPPRLLDQRVVFEPALDGRLRQTMARTPTWMAGQAKVAVAYAAPFWRQRGRSGSAFADFAQATLGEVHDACDAEGTAAALGGFLALAPEVRRQFKAGLPMLIGSQLANWFGGEAEPEEFLVQDWAEEPYTASTLDQSPSPDEIRYGGLPLRLSHWNDKLYFGGSETAAYGGGYLEGALEAAGRIRRELALGWGLAA